MIDAEVAAHADQPRLKICAAVEGIERLEDLQEDLLREIFRLVVLADELVGHVEHFAPVLADDEIPGRLIVLEAPLNQRFNRLGDVWLSGAHGW